MWIKKTCFEAQESPIQPGKYIIVPIHENFKLEKTEGSFNIICARLLGLTYAQYLRFCRDICGAQIVGKGSMYPVAYFSGGEMMSQLVRLLNNRANLVLWEAEHPDWKEHQEELKKMKEMKELADALRRKQTD
jgi:hypothetical protein